MAQQKTKEQLLHLSKNPYFKFTKEEQERLDDFLSEQQDSDSKKSQKRNSKKSDKKTNVRVKNVVEKADTEPETHKNSSDAS